MSVASFGDFRFLIFDWVLELPRLRGGDAVAKVKGRETLPFLYRFFTDFTG
jgi:hypothetical protein